MEALETAPDPAARPLNEWSAHTAYTRIREAVEKWDDGVSHFGITFRFHLTRHGLQIDGATVRHSCSHIVGWNELEDCTLNPIEKHINAICSQLLGDARGDH